MEETKRRRFIIRAVLEGEVDVQEAPPEPQEYFVDAVKAKGYWSANKEFVYNFNVSNPNNKNALAYIQIDPGKTYRVTKDLSPRFRVSLFSVEPVQPESLSGSNQYTTTQSEANHAGTEITITAGDSDLYMVIEYEIATASAEDQQAVFDSISVKEA